MGDPKKKEQADNEKDSRKTAGKKKENQSEEVEEHDFGGLPDRDLKKNLGCGG